MATSAANAATATTVASTLKMIFRDFDFRAKSSEISARGLPDGGGEGSFGGNAGAGFRDGNGGGCGGSGGAEDLTGSGGGTERPGGNGGGVFIYSPETSVFVAVRRAEPV